MPIATLKFKLPEENLEFKRATDGAIYHIILWELDQEFRSYIKYEENDEKAKELAQKWRNRLNELCLENQVDL